VKEEPIPSWIKRLTLVIALSVAHYVVSFGLFAWWLKMKMDLLEGEYRPLDTLETVVKGSAEVLSRPLVPLFPRMAVWFSFAINSLAWGIGLGAIVLVILSVTRKRQGAGPAP
jgi:hypothetical protein